ncbi:hypothetical protein C7960_0750 [Methanohalophilus euhalobius]|uniref:Uncharacterized protein n=1 Tax=Methanohalophilus euhalobius TaxID=51203 RepID=A0A285GBZ2_9EURY|nr:MAG: hypothetical protein A8273_1849 [Methanohalophilus sp. 2-GBenrich]RSD35329.1 MAG: hypothetical protein CI952_1032 [Methanohalophilus sp.]TCL11586.1 hypothetical protein C7960_0750 [Methanohalophilus euhalobius]SNY20694.1 hypothetical protein SAMN06295989_11153 [Methanohalophilus euhalobius]
MLLFIGVGFGASVSKRMNYIWCIYVFQNVSDIRIRLAKQFYTIDDMYVIIII